MPLHENETINYSDKIIPKTETLQVGAREGGATEESREQKLGGWREGREGRQEGGRKRRKEGGRRTEVVTMQ